MQYVGTSLDLLTFSLGVLCTAWDAIASGLPGQVAGEFATIKSRLDAVSHAKMVSSLP
jgi:hypothetical protein